MTEDQAAEEQGIEEEPQSEEEEKKEMDAGEKEEDVYSEAGREQLVDDGEISPNEEGFAQEVEKASKPDEKEEEEKE